MLRFLSPPRLPALLLKPLINLSNNYSLTCFSSCWGTEGGRGGKAPGSPPGSQPYVSSPSESIAPNVLTLPPEAPRGLGPVGSHPEDAFLVLTRGGTKTAEDSLSQ